MAKKKTRYPKRKGQIIRGSIIGIFILAIIAAGIYGMNVLDKQSKSYIMTFDGNKISTADFDYYRTMLQLQGLQDDVSSYALDMLTDHLIVSKEAKNRGITLTEEEKAELEITDEHILELASVNSLYTKLYDEVTKDYVIDEAAFKTAFDEYLSSDDQIGIDTKVKYVVAPTQEKAEEARAKFLSGTSIDDVIKEYSQYYDEQSPIVSYSLKDLGLSQDMNDKVTALEPMGITEVMPLEGAFIIIEVEEIIVHTQEEMEAAQREEYIKNDKDKIFEDLFTQWKEASVIEINEKAYGLYE